MIRNRLSLLQIFAMLVLGLSFSLLAFAWTVNDEILLRVDYETTSGNNGLMWVRNGLIIVSLLMAVPAIGLLFRQKWPVITFIVLFWLIGIAWTVGVGLIFYNLSRADRAGFTLIAGFSALVYASLLAGILYLDNAYVLESLGEGEEVQAEHFPDVLDQ